MLYMSEFNIGLTFPDYFTALMRSKIGSTSARRDISLVGSKVKGEEAMRMWNGEVYAEIIAGLVRSSFS